MSPEDRWYLMQFANCLASSERLHCGIPIPPEQVTDKVVLEGEGSVYIQISHALAMQAALKLGSIAINDRANEQEESTDDIADAATST